MIDKEGDKVSFIEYIRKYLFRGYDIIKVKILILFDGCLIGF